MFVEKSCIARSQRFGIATGELSFSFLLIDTGIGMGLMVNGEICRGG